MEYAQNVSFFFKVLEAKTAFGEAENKSVINYYNIIQQSFTVKLYSCNHKLWSNPTNAFLIRYEFSHTIPSVCRKQLRQMPNNARIHRRESADERSEDAVSVRCNELLGGAFTINP